MINLINITIQFFVFLRSLKYTNGINLKHQNICHINIQKSYTQNFRIFILQIQYKYSERDTESFVEFSDSLDSNPYLTEKYGSDELKQFDYIDNDSPIVFNEKKIQLPQQYLDAIKRLSDIMVSNDIRVNKIKSSQNSETKQMLQIYEDEKIQIKQQRSRINDLMTTIHDSSTEQPFSSLNDNSLFGESIISTIL